MQNELGELREQIDAVDRKMVGLLSQRFGLTEKVGIYKKKNKLKPYDKKRETEMMEKRTIWGNREGLGENFLKRIFREIIKEVRNNHRKIADKKNGKK